MTYLRRVATYLVCVCVALLLSSLWQMKFGAGRADLSFLVFVPFAIGLLRPRSWALWGTGILGGLSSALVIGIAVVHSILRLPDLELRLGPIMMTRPSAFRVWMFAWVYLIALGLPMFSVLAKRKVVGIGDARQISGANHGQR